MTPLVPESRDVAAGEDLLSAVSDGVTGVTGVTDSVSGVPDEVTVTPSTPDGEAVSAGSDLVEAVSDGAIGVTDVADTAALDAALGVTVPGSASAGAVDAILEPPGEGAGNVPDGVDPNPADGAILTPMTPEGDGVAAGTDLLEVVSDGEIGLTGVEDTAALDAALGLIPSQSDPVQVLEVAPGEGNGQAGIDRDPAVGSGAGEVTVTSLTSDAEAVTAGAGLLEAVSDGEIGLTGVADTAALNAALGLTPPEQDPAVQAGGVVVLPDSNGAGPAEGSGDRDAYLQVPGDGRSILASTTGTLVASSQPVPVLEPVDYAGTGQVVAAAEVAPPTDDGLTFGFTEPATTATLDALLAGAGNEPAIGFTDAATTAGLDRLLAPAVGAGEPGPLRVWEAGVQSSTEEAPTFGFTEPATTMRLDELLVPAAGSEADQALRFGLTDPATTAALDAALRNAEEPVFGFTDPATTRALDPYFTPTTPVVVPPGGDVANPPTGPVRT
ncbi:MAG: hypothetical protein H7Y15_16600, partial [Pseudonocardia sp.]|nr:hypothetical protein [Pseudonocardia sp.]